MRLGRPVRKTDSILLTVPLTKCERSRNAGRDRLTVEGHSIAENYAEGCLSFICDFNIRMPEAWVVRGC